MKNIARPMYSNPPLHGALLVTKILQDPALKNLWYDVSNLTGCRVCVCACVRACVRVCVCVCVCVCVWRMCQIA